MIVAHFQKLILLLQCFSKLFYVKISQNIPKVEISRHLISFTIIWPLMVVTIMLTVGGLTTLYSMKISTYATNFTMVPFLVPHLP